MQCILKSPHPSIAFQFVKKFNCNYYEIDAIGIHVISHYILSYYIIYIILLYIILFYFIERCPKAFWWSSGLKTHMLSHIILLFYILSNYNIIIFYWQVPEGVLVVQWITHPHVITTLYHIILSILYYYISYYFILLTGARRHSGGQVD